MKKRISVLLCAISIILPMMFVNVANAEILDTGISAVFKENDGTNVTYDVYIKGYEEVYSIDFYFKPSDATNFDVANAVWTEKQFTDNTNFMTSYHSFTKTLRVVFASTTPLNIDSSNPIASVSIPLKNQLTKNEEMTATKYALTVQYAGSPINVAYSIDPAEPASAVIAGEVEDDEDLGLPAAPFYINTTITSGKTPYWTADITKDNVKKSYKKAATTANMSGSGTVMLGLIYVGSETISNVALSWE